MLGRINIAAILMVLFGAGLFSSSVSSMYARDARKLQANDTAVLLGASESGDVVTDHLLTPMMQTGLGLGFLVSLSALLWLIKANREDSKDYINKLVALQEKNHDVISSSTSSRNNMANGYQLLAQSLERLAGRFETLFEAMIRRPCLRADEHLQQDLANYRSQQAKEHIPQNPVSTTDNNQTSSQNHHTGDPS